MENDPLAAPIGFGTIDGATYTPIYTTDEANEIAAAGGAWEPANTQAGYDMGVELGYNAPFDTGSAAPTTAAPQSGTLPGTDYPVTTGGGIGTSEGIGGGGRTYPEMSLPAGGAGAMGYAPAPGGGPPAQGPTYVPTEDVVMPAAYPATPPSPDGSWTGGEYLGAEPIPLPQDIPVEADATGAGYSGTNGGYGSGYGRSTGYGSGYQGGGYNNGGSSGGGYAPGGGYGSGGGGGEYSPQYSGSGGGYSGGGGSPSGYGAPGGMPQRSGFSQGLHAMMASGPPTNAGLRSLIGAPIAQMPGQGMDSGYSIPGQVDVAGGGGYSGGGGGYVPRGITGGGSSGGGGYNAMGMAFLNKMGGGGSSGGYAAPASGASGPTGGGSGTAPGGGGGMNDGLRNLSGWAGRQGYKGAALANTVYDNPEWLLPDMGLDPGTAGFELAAGLPDPTTMATIYNGDRKGWEGAPDDIANYYADTVDKTMNGSQWFDFEEGAQNVLDPRKGSVLADQYGGMTPDQQMYTAKNYLSTLANTTLGPTEAAALMSSYDARSAEIGNQSLHQKPGNYGNMLRKVGRGLF